MVRSRCQARTQTLSSLIASRGVWVYSPISLQELVVRKAQQLGFVTLRPQAGLCLGSRQGLRLPSCIFNRVGAVVMWEDGYEYDHG